MCLNWEDYDELKGLDKALIHRYILLGKLGKGTFGTVFKVRDKKLGRECALKLLNIDEFEEPEDKVDAKRRFIKEAQTLAGCKHDNIVTIYDTGGETTIPYFVMEYIHGTSLREILSDKHHLEFQEIMNISNDILSALGFMHGKGKAHRDLKPGNIMIESGSQKSLLIDFGIVKDLKKNTSYTHSGKTIGTPLYMSPEQFKNGRTLDFRTDIYSYGVILFKMLTGKCPYNGSLALILMGHLQEPVPDVTIENTSSPPALQTVINRAMAKKPEDRYQGTEEFLDALKVIADDKTVKVTKAIMENHKKDKEKAPQLPGGNRKPDEIQDINDKPAVVDVERPIKKPWGKRIRIIIDYIALVVTIISIIWGVKSLIDENAKKKAQAFQRYVKSARMHIEKNDLNNALQSLNKAKKIENSQEVQQLFNTIINKKRASMSKDFKNLKGLLGGDLSLEKKKAACDEFLNNYKDIPPNSDTRKMIEDIRNSANLVKYNIETEKQYRGYISSANAFLLTGDFSKALGELEKAKKIKPDGEEIKSLTLSIHQTQIKAMTDDYDGLKASLNKVINKDVKLKNCRRFIAKYKDIPQNKAAQKMIDDVNVIVGLLQSEIIKDTAYKQTLAAMRKDTETLEKKLQGDMNPLTEKVRLCREFLTRYKNVPRNKETNPFIAAANNYMKQYDAEIKKEKQYTQYMDSAQNYLRNKEYQKAETAFSRAYRIKETPEANAGLTAARAKIKELRDNEKINGDTLYNRIKTNINRNNYLDFKKKFPQSVHLKDLKTRVAANDKNLPPEKYWNEPINKNSRGYYEYTFTNGHLMIYIPGKNFWIDKYEVSWKQYRAFLRFSGKPLPPIREKKMKREEDKYPATITYTDALQYSKRYGFRLPTEKEWQYAAGKDRLTYPWGNESADAGGIFRANFDSFEDGFDGTAPVNSFAGFSSPIGAINMAGNISEWIQGIVLKGGDFFSDKEELAITRRSKASSKEKEGFRCIKEER